MDDPDVGLKDDVALRWTFGISVVVDLVITIIKLAWMVFSLPSNDNGGGIAGAMAVGAIEFMRDLVILEVVRRVFLRFTIQGTK
jgi:hypothetical protein